MNLPPPPKHFFKCIYFYFLCISASLYAYMCTTVFTWCPRSPDKDGSWELNPCPLKDQLSLHSPGTCFVGQTSLELTEICLCLPSTGIKGMHYHAWLLIFFVKSAFLQFKQS